MNPSTLPLPGGFVYALELNSIEIDAFCLFFADFSPCTDCAFFYAFVDIF